jgi:hypothetical protein
MLNLRHTGHTLEVMAIPTKRLLATACVLGAALLTGCSSVIDGDPSCPGCGTNAEPEFPTPRPSAVTPPPVASPPASPRPPGPAPTPGPSPGAERLPTDSRGYVYVETKSGKTRCQLNTETVGCESAFFENSPVIDGAPANGVSVTADGNLRWILGNLGDIPTVALDYRTYQAVGWTIAADSEGTRFTNDGTGHGMFVRIEGVDTF